MAYTGYFPHATGYLNNNSANPYAAPAQNMPMSAGAPMSPPSNAPMTSGAPQSGGATSSQIPGWLKAAGVGGGGAALMDWFGGSNDGYKSTMGDPGGYLSQVPDILKKYMAPYEQMVTDPTGKMKELGSHYEESPGYGFEMGQELQAGSQAAAAGGMSGSPQQQYQAQGTAQGLASKDYNQYLQQAMGMYMGGAQGYGRLGEDLSSNLMSQAQLAQTQQEEEERSKEQGHSDMWGNIGAIIGGAASFL